MKARSRAIILAAIVAAAGAGAWALLHQGAATGASLRYATHALGYADISATVTESGIVNPVTQVQVGSEVSGTIRTLSVDYNSVVTKGQVLMTLDPTTYQAAVDSSQANLRLTQATLNSAQVNVGKMKALLDQARSVLARDEPLAKQGYLNQNQIDSERTAAVTAEQDYLGSQSSVKVAEAQVSVAQGQLEQARYNLSKTVITSPFDGIVMARNISLGQTVASALQTPTLFTLATNLTDMQVDTSVDEADIGSVKAGESAQITVTAFPNLSFPGTVSQVRVNPTTVQNVVTYDAVVSVHDSSGRLLPGMTAQVSIEVGKKSHVLTVPIAAVLYRPLAAPNPQATPAGLGGGGGGFGAAVVQGSGAPPSQVVAGAPGSRVTLWLLRSGVPTPAQVVIGLSDGKNIEITGGDLVEGDPVIVAQYRGTARNRGEASPSKGRETPSQAASAPAPAGANGAAPAAAAASSPTASSPTAAKDGAPARSEGAPGARIRKNRGGSGAESQGPGSHKPAPIADSGSGTDSPAGQ